MTADTAALAAPMVDDQWAGGHIEVVPLTEGHRQGLRACCQQDDPVWGIYPYNMSGDNFDPLFDLALAGPDRQVFAILVDGTVRGMTAYVSVRPDRHGLEVGGTFLAPDARGTGLNARVKRLVLGRAYAAGFRRVEFRVDKRNLRSQAAVRKLGALEEGVLRQERTTWTGHVRDTVVFSLLAHEWAARG